ncbi:MAG: hypothetical protein Q4F72_08290, partial [Desulfovibrionaceae bacterium]|nr:hypothetical protein [Desulfovibrionaceae bacterium]
DRTKPIVSVRESFQRAGITCDDIIPYSARETDWNDCRKRLLAALERAAKGRSREDRVEQMRSLLGEIRQAFETALARRKESGEIEEIDRVLDRAANPLGLQSLVRLRGLVGSEHSNLRHDFANFRTLSQKMLNWAEERQRAAR